MKTTKFKQTDVFEFTPNIAEVQINWSANIPASQREKIGSSADCNKILKSLWPETIEYRETFFALLLDRANKILGAFKVSEGGIAGTVVDPKMIFQAALLSNASFIILAHNHPSGNLKPSDSDIRLTKNLKLSGDMLEIKIIDHLIITKDAYYSFADEGMM